MTVLLLLTS